jgi:tetratricopeptide (TPR) repeat protein
MDADILIKMGFFISDLHRQIEKLHKEQFSGHHASKTFTVFRGQGLSKAYFDQLLKTKGNLMCFNNFLSTSKDFDVSLDFANSALADPNSVGILFVMTINPSISTTPFASINGISCFPAEAEVLFSMHTIFRIDDIKVRDEHGRLFQVNLTLISNDDKDVHNLTECIRAETYPHLNGWYRLGQLLLKMGQSDKAQQVYEALLEHETDESLRETIYHEIGRAKDNQGQYKDAIKFYEKSLQIKEKTLSSNHLGLAHTYSNIGVAYYNLGDYSKAISYYEKALELQQQSLPPDHSDLALSYNNIGNAYYNIGLYSKVLSFHEKALEIKRKTLPPNHPDLAKSYNNIGIVYRKMGEYSTTLSLYKKALEIREQSLPSNHPDLAASHNNIGLVYLDMNEHLNALWSHERAVEIREQSLHPNHPDLAKSYSNLGSVYEAMNDYKGAVSFYKRAVTIGQRSLPPDHPNLQQWQKKLEVVEKKL